MESHTVQRIKAKRLSLKFTLERLAAELQQQGFDISPANLSNLERGLRRLNPDELPFFARALRCDPNYLVGWKDPNSSR